MSDLADVLRSPGAVTLGQLAQQLDALAEACEHGPVRDEYRRLVVTLEDEVPE